MKKNFCRYCKKEINRTNIVCKECNEYTKYVQFFQRLNFDYTKYNGLKEAYEEFRKYIKKMIDKKNGIWVFKFLNLSKTNHISNFLRNFKLLGEVKIICPYCCKEHDGTFKRGIFCSERCKQDFIRFFTDYKKTSKTLYKYYDFIRKLAQFYLNNKNILFENDIENKLFNLIKEIKK